MPESTQTISLRAAGALTVGVKDRWESPFNGEVVSVAAVVGTAPTGATAILDLKKNGVTMFTTAANRPTIPISATESATEPSADPDVTTFAAGDTLTLDIIQGGATGAGSDAERTVEISRS